MNNLICPTLLGTSKGLLGGSCWRSLTIISRRQLDQKIMRVCISYTHLYPIKSLNHTLPFRICKLCFQANMQVTSKLWTKSDARTQFRQAKTGQDQCGPDKEAQDSLLEEDGGGWRHWQADRPTGRPTWPMGPIALVKPRVASYCSFRSVWRVSPRGSLL